MGKIDHHVAGKGVGVLVHFVDVEHRPRRNARGFKAGKPVLGRVFEEDRRQQILQFPKVGHAAGVFLEPVVFGQLRRLDHLQHPQPVLLIGGAGAMHEVYGDKIRKLNILPVLYILSLLPAVFFFTSSAR